MLLQCHGIPCFACVRGAKKLVGLFLFFIGLQVHAQDSTFVFSQLNFVHGQYFLEGEPVTGVALEYFPSGKRQVIARLHDGYLHGIAKRYHDNGQLHLVQNFNQGELCKKFSAYYPNGEVQLRGHIREQNPSGSGHLIFEVYYGFYHPENNTYELKRTHWKILELLVGEYGYTEFNNHIPFHLQSGFRLRDRRRKHRGIFIDDSRKMYFPGIEEAVKAKTENSLIKYRGRKLKKKRALLFDKK